jgi:membrane-bound inhibitor of C-type lysozyme
MKRSALGLGIAAFLLPLPVLGANIALTVTLPDPGEWQHVSYVCEGREERLPVDYLNAAPNFLALVPIEGKTVIFANVLAASGARYAASHYEWWTKGAEAHLTDLTAPEDAPPLLTCLEANDTP